MYNMDLKELIKTGGLLFYSGGARLDTEIEYSDKNNWNIVNKLADQANNSKRGRTEEIILMKGNSLEAHLSKPDNLFQFADFLVQLITKTPLDNFIKIETDMGLLNRYEALKEPEKIIPLQYKDNLRIWAPRLTAFQRCWYLSLDFHMGEYIGHLGYEHPLNATEFWQRKNSLDGMFRLREEKQQ